MNTLKRLYIVYLFATVSLGISSCAEKNEKEINLTNEVVQAEVKMSEYDTIENYEFVPPSTLQVASIFKKAGLIYNAKLTNSRKKVEDYSSKFEQSLAFGIYSSDLTYSVVHEKYDQAADFLKTLRILGNKIGLETVFNSEDLIERFDRNIGIQDSIIDILIYVQDNTDKYIEENGKVDLSVIYYTGAWVEGMYLGANTIMEDENRKTGVLISEQMTIAEILLEGLEHIKGKDDEILDLIDTIRDLVSTFHELESVKNIRNQVDYVDFSLSKEEASLISSKIIELRETIVH